MLKLKRRNRPSSSSPPLAEKVTATEGLREKGYQTFHIGKWHLGHQDGMASHQQGFEQSLLMADGLYLPEDNSNVVNTKLNFDPIDKFLWTGVAYANSCNSGDINRFEPEGFLTDYWTDQSIKVINANKNKPFFVSGSLECAYDLAGNARRL